MNVLPMPSLKRTCLVKMAVALWMKKETLRETTFLGEEDVRADGWWRIENVASAQINLLGLSDGLDQDLANIMKPIGIQILKWLTFHTTRYLGIGFPSDARWTCQGLVDKIKTAKSIIWNESVNITIRFKLACLYCFEKDIKALWSRISEMERPQLYRESSVSKYASRLVLLWIHHITDGTSDISSKAKRYLEDRSFIKGSFDVAVRGANDVAVEYFLKRLTDREKESLVRYSETTFTILCTLMVNFIDAPPDYNKDVARILVSNMTLDQQNEVFESGPCSFLLCYLDWPWQSSLLQVAETNWAFFSPEDFYNILTQITRRMVDGYKDPDYQTLWQALYERTEEPHRAYIINKCHEQLLLDLLNLRLWEPIRLLLSSATTDQKESIISNYRVRSVFKYLIYGNKLEFLMQFLRQCISSEETMEKFQHSYEYKYIECSSKRNLTAKDRQWKEFLIQLDILALQYKRNSPV